MVKGRGLLSLCALPRPHNHFMGNDIDNRHDIDDRIQVPNIAYRVLGGFQN